MTAYTFPVAQAGRIRRHRTGPFYAGGYWRSIAGPRRNRQPWKSASGMKTPERAASSCWGLRQAADQQHTSSGL